MVYLTSTITYKGSKLDISSKQNILDPFFSEESWVDICTYKGSKLGIIAKESKLDWSTYMEYKLGTKLLKLL